MVFSFFFRHISLLCWGVKARKIIWDRVEKIFGIVRPGNGDAAGE